jgi:twinkle protein
MSGQKVFHRWSDTGIDLKGRNHGQLKTRCPKCSDTRNDKRDKSLSVDIDKKVWNCHYPPCSWSGGIMEEMQNKTSYIRPEPRSRQFGEKVEGWFKSRGISKETLEYFQITESVEWMPQTDKNGNCINFNYYRDKELINIKFRDGAKNFKMVSKAELIFYNLNAIKGRDECIICEGEVDCMSLYEASLFNAVSVPNGASKGNAKLEYLDNCWPYFQHMKKVVIATDGDDAGLMLREELARRIGKEICYFVEYPEGCKDSNEVLVKFGREKLNEVIRSAKQYPLEGIQTLNDVEDELEYIYKYGFPKGDTIGYPNFDRLISWRRGEFTTITGIPQSGKSNFIDQIMIRLSARHGWKFGVFSPESAPVQLHSISLIQKYVGQTFAGKNKMSVEHKDRAKKFVNENYWFLKFNEIDLTIDGILAKARELVLRYGIDGLVIDPFNYIEFNMTQGETETQYISKVLTKIKTFCELNNVHIWLVAHPTKIAKDKNTKMFEVPNLYSISGSANFFNKTYNGFTVYRNYKTGVVDVHVQKVKFFFMGEVGMASFLYDKEGVTGRYAEVEVDPDTEQIVARQAWENEMGDFAVQAEIPLEEVKVPQLTPINELLRKPAWDEIMQEEEAAPF